MTEEEMKRLTDGVAVKSDRIRILYRKGAERTEIASFMGVHYSYVQSILKRSNLIETAADRQKKKAEETRVWTLRVEKGGRITLPPEITGELGIADGETLICRTEEGGLLIMSREAAAAFVRGIARERMPGEAALLDVLLGDPPRST